jgi:hypothetical protein
MARHVGNAVVKNDSRGHRIVKGTQGLNSSYRPGGRGGDGVRRRVGDRAGAADVGVRRRPRRLGLRVWNHSGESDPVPPPLSCWEAAARAHRGPGRHRRRLGVANGSTCALRRTFSIGSPDSRPMLDCPRRLHVNTAASATTSSRKMRMNSTGSTPSQICYP